MRGTAVVLLAVSSLVLSPAAQSQTRRIGRLQVQTVNGRDAVAGEALVKFRRPVQPRDLPAIAAETSVEQIEAIGRSGVFRVTSRGLGVAALVANLTARPDVEYAEPNAVVRVAATPNDPRFSEVWGLLNIHAPGAWDISTGSTEHVVAVVDTGIDYTHPDLAANMWSAPSAFTVTIGGAPVTCPAGSHGFNAITRTCNPMDDRGHGTHVAGTIGAVGNNGTGVAGVNWTTRLMAIKFLDAAGAGTVADAINGLQFAIEVKRAFATSGAADVRVLSNSWGTTSFSQALLDEVRATNDEDLLFVAAAGNSSVNNDLLPTYPGSFDSPNVISVAALTSWDALAWFSNYGKNAVHLGAPGADILSTLSGGGYGLASGTSMATPHVSGAAALVLSRCDMNALTLKDAILGSVESIPNLPTITGGMLDVNSAIHSCTAPPPTPTGLAAGAGNGYVELSWAASLGAIRYSVKRGSTSGGPYTVIAPAVNGTRFSDTGVVNGTTYYYVVSAGNSLGESGDSTEVSATPNIPSDVVVSQFTVPTVAGAGRPLAVSVTTKNQGSGPAGPSTTAFFLSSNYVWDAGDRRLDEQSVPALPAGTSSSASLSLMIPEDASTGIHYLFGRADADQALIESRENNNQVSRMLRVGPDLAISGWTAPTTARPGSTITASETTKNAGGGDVSPSVTRFYLSPNNWLDNTDRMLDGVHTVPPLANGASHFASTALTIPSDVATGIHYLFAKADGEDAVVEANEGNNTAIRSIAIGPDLVMSSLTAPSSATAGASVTASYSVKNQGAADAGPFTIGFHLSTNWTLDASDVALNATGTMTGLAAGASASATAAVTIPADTAPGNYYVIAQVDATNSVLETHESNNARARLIRIESAP